MFRRPFIRPLRRAIRRDVHPLLRRANELMASGNYQAAAEAYEQLAIGAQRRGIPRDAHLFLQAGRCRMLSGQVPAGMTNLKQGFSILAQRGHLQLLQKAGEHTIADLQQRGLIPEAAEIEVLLKAVLPGVVLVPSLNSPAIPQEKPRLLPTSCSDCGAPLRSDEVEWVDEVTAECPYCGGAVRAE